jgi:methyl-accepting chemotaxis protein
MKAHEVLLVLMTRSHQQARMMGDTLEVVSEIRQRLEDGGKAVEGNTKATLHQSAVLARIQTALEEQGQVIADMAEHAEKTVVLLQRVTLVVQVFATASVLLLIGYLLLLLLGR